MRIRRVWPVCMAFCFLFLLADDMGEGHETLGRALQHLARPASLPGPLAEMLGFGLIAVVELSCLGLAAVLGGPAARAALRAVVPPLMVVACFGFGVDALHALANPGGMLDGIWVMLEEGGEMLAASLVLDRVRHPG